MMAENIEVSKVEAKIVMSRVSNGYLVTRRAPGSKEPSGIFDAPETEDFVFRTLAEVVEFLGDHYKEPVRGL